MKRPVTAVKDATLTDLGHAMLECMIANPGLTQSEAYRRACAKTGQAPSKAPSQSAWQIASRPEFKSAMAIVREERAKRMERTVDEVVRDLIRVGADAEAAGDFPTAVRALELQGRHLGAFTERHHHLHLQSTSAIDQMTSEERQARIAVLRKLIAEHKAEKADEG